MTKDEAKIIKAWLEEGRLNCLKVINKYTAEKGDVSNIPFIETKLEKARAFGSVLQSLQLKMDLEKLNDEEEN